MNRRSTLEQLTLGNYAATQLWENWLAQLRGSWVSESSASRVAIALPFPRFELLRLFPRVQLSLITILGNCGCVAVASFFGVPPPLNSLLSTVVDLCYECIEWCVPVIVRWRVENASSNMVIFPGKLIIQIPLSTQLKFINLCSTTCFDPCRVILRCCDLHIIIEL
jgi:hypothetical protein